ncbi:MAG: hypothetical protein ACLR23_13440 [Clostridia bacterium]
MHAGEASNSSDQRAHGDKFLAAIVKTIPPSEKWNKNARRQGEERHRQRAKGGKFPAVTVKTIPPSEKRH